MFQKVYINFSNNKNIYINIAIDTRIYIDTQKRFFKNLNRMNTKKLEIVYF